MLLIGKNKAFTLAEILVTLSIIGVIASMTIPNLVQDTNDAELYSKWRKAYAEIYQATMMLNSLYGGIDFTTETNLRNDYEKVLKFVKKDQWNNIAASKYLFYKNTQGQGWNSADAPAVVLANGSLVRFGSYGTGGGMWGSVPNMGTCTSQAINLTGVCGYIYIDVNGKKGPNMWGRDFFDVFVVIRNGNYIAYPMGSNNDGYTCTNGSTGLQSSEGCSSFALRTDNMP